MYPRAFLHLECRAHGTIGIVLSGHRDTPDRKDRITDDLVDVAAETVDDLSDQGHGAIDDRAHVFRIDGRGERGEPREVGEEDRREPTLLHRRRLGMRRVVDTRGTGKHRTAASAEP